MQRHLLATIGCIILSASSFEAGAEEPPPPTVKTLVMPFNLGEGIDPALVELITDVAMTQLSDAGSRELIGQADIAAALDLEAQKQLLGCSDVGCLEELAGAMDVDSLITGTINKVGDGFLVIITELDAREVKQLARVQGTSGPSESDLLRTVSRITEELIVKTSGQIQLFGDVVIETEPSGLTVHIDEREVGTSPVRMELPIGVRRVKIIAPNGAHNPADFDMAIFRKQTTTATARMSVPQVVPDDIMAEYQETRQSHTLFTGVKGCTGLFWSVIGLGLSPLYIFSFFGYAPAFAPIFAELSSGYLSLSSLIILGPLSITAIVSAVCLCAGLGGLGLLGWAIADVFSFPEEPLPDGPQHLVEVQTPEGSPKTYRLPARESTMAH